MDLLDRFGIEYKEIHVAEYLHVAERHGFPIPSEMQRLDENANEVDKGRSSMRQPNRSSTGPVLRVTTGARVNAPPHLPLEGKQLRSRVGES